ncbi:hypothetical protein [Desulfitobacterium sp. AusDCA]|uniref:hypothetical protein n=1 Tax=Desulfitobacterium sp. AusDCA TaxID=3240383 RepID=UPI003DA72DED
MDKNITDSYSGLQSVKENGKGISITVQEVTKGVIGQTESIYQINQMMNKANEKVLETQEISRKLRVYSGDSSAVALKGSEVIDVMDRQMFIINNAVTESVTTVKELQKDMKNFIIYKKNL